MLDFNNIEDVEFSYFDENGYIYSFNVNENKKKLLSNGEFETYMICNETNSTANGEVSLKLKVEKDSLSFKTDYFANNFDFIKLNQDLEKTTINMKVYSIKFNKDIFELKLFLSV